MLYTGMGQAARRRYIKAVSSINDREVASHAVLYERLMGVYGNLRNGVAEGIAVGANHALRMWPDPALGAAFDVVAASAEERRNGRHMIQLNADLYPFDGIIPVEVLNILYAIAQPRCSVAVGQLADVMIVHANALWLYIYGNDSRRQTQRQHEPRQ